MADIRPFRGILYDPERVGGLEAVVGPPEDILSREQAQAIVAGRPYHAVRLETADDDRAEHFRRAEADFRRWLELGVLRQSDRPAFYAHEHRFRLGGAERTRHGLFAALRLPEPDNDLVLPHERTLPHNVAVRTRLLQDVQANLSPVYTLIADQGQMAATMSQIVARPADIAGSDSEGGHHRLWRVCDPATIWALREAVARRPLYIADGHHRYAAALAYRDELRAGGCAPCPADWILAYIADVTDPGIAILPINRVVRSLEGRPWPALRRSLCCYFEVASTPLPADPAEAERQVMRAAETMAVNDSRPHFLIVGPGGRELLQLALRDWERVAPLVPAGSGPVAGRLDVTALDAVLLRRLLGWDVATIERRVEFTPSVETAFDLVRSGAAALAALVRPTPLPALLAVARAGDRMPQKSTYFYPKIPIGLLMRDLRDVDEGDPDAG